ncbi:MAG TPA: adenylate cyclase [Firmicutes bacterium]|jgi:adenylate cyclase|nr:adenylate cyclase [Bacillota bacterium]
MGKEIERKFLVVGDDYRQSAKSNFIIQGYLCNEAERVVRVRLYNDQGFITIKGKTVGMTRSEYEYEIPFADANEMINRLCAGTIIEKVRYEFEDQGYLWEIDEFQGENQGLIVAEIELEDENDVLSLPKWIAGEVTDDPRYLNANLVKKPYKQW